jgi:hypothetical protein
MESENLTREQLIRDLSILVNHQDNQNENECGKILENPEIASVLLPLGVKQIIVDTQLRTSSGDADFLICIEESVASGDIVRRLFVWELKAPQVFLFRTETNGRAGPTKELYSAENQLLHYHKYISGSTEDRTKYKILHPDDVKFGGIIIGKKANFVENKRSTLKEDHALRIAETARKIREKMFYEFLGIKLFTWDNIVERLESITLSHQKHEQTKIETISLEEGPSISGSVDLPHINNQHNNY